MAMQIAGILSKTPQFLENLIIIKLKSQLFLNLFFSSYQRKFENVTGMNYKG